MPVLLALVFLVQLSPSPTALVLPALFARLPELLTLQAAQELA